MLNSYKKIAYTLLPDITIVSAFFALAALSVELLIPGVFSLQKTLFAAIAVTCISAILYEAHPSDGKDCKKEVEKAKNIKRLLATLLSVGGIIMLTIATRGLTPIMQVGVIITCIVIAVLFIKTSNEL